MYLLDTNVLSELRLNDRANSLVRQWERQTPPELMFISPVSIAELTYGWRKLAKQAPNRAEILKQWIDGLLEAFAQRIVSIDAACGLEFGRLLMGRSRPVNDQWLAATALAHSLVVVTRNTSDFADSGARLLNPWLARPA
jgi:toxin FitB